MILYLDTSSLVKLYVEEDESSKVDALVRSSDLTATSIIAYAETRAAFARRFREKAFEKVEYDRIKEHFEGDWARYFVLNVTGDLVFLAGDLAEKHSLRGFDSIHLASALTLQRTIDSPLIFSCFDDRLEKAAVSEELES